MAFLTILILPIHKHGISIYLCLLKFLIQHSIGNPGQSTQAGKGSRRHPNWKEDVNSSLFMDNMIL